MVEKLPSGLTFAYAVLNKIRLSPLAFGIVPVHRRVTYVTEKVLTTRHGCVLDRYTCDLDMNKQLANCKLCTTYCSVHPYKKFFSTNCTVLRNLTDVLGTSMSL
jgi:hypothetical protein